MNRPTGYSDILDLIPERPPLLMVDRLEIAADGLSAKGAKCVSMDEPHFQGHFPEKPIMPGVLQVAGMTQLSGVLLKRYTKDSAGDAIAVLKSLRRIKFRRPVYPGALLLIETVLKENEDGKITFSAKTTVDGKTACQGILELVLVDRNQLETAPGELVTPLREIPEPEGKQFDTLDVMKAIPHRFPFLLIDRTPLLTYTRAIGLKNVTGNEPIFQGTPALTFPGYLQVEGAAQAACAAALQVPGNENKLGYFVSIDSARFLKPVQVGDRLLMDLKLIDRGRFGAVEGNLYVGDTVVTELALKFAIVDPE